MILATEVRWFWPAHLDPQVETWFRSSPELLGGALADAEVDARTDHYLLDPESTAFGLKLREEKLELKRLLDASFFRAPRTGVEGAAQLWTKSQWSHRADAEGSEDAVVIAFLRGPNAATVASVEKRRWQRKYVPGASGSPTPVPSKQQLPWACNVEVTTLRLRNVHWWTIGFEAYGEPEHPGTLASTVDWFFDRFEGEKPAHAQSASYPEWLTRFGGRQP